MAFTIKHDPPDDADIISIFNSVTDVWNSFPHKDTTPKERGAILRLIYSGLVFYKEINYYESNTAGKKGLFLEYHVSGHADPHVYFNSQRQKFLERFGQDDQLRNHMRDHCPGDPVVINGGENFTEWILKLTEAGMIWRESIRRYGSNALTELVTYVTGSDASDQTEGPYVSYGDRGKGRHCPICQT